MRMVVAAVLRDRQQLGLAVVEVGDTVILLCLVLRERRVEVAILEAARGGQRQRLLDSLVPS